MDQENKVSNLTKTYKQVQDGCKYKNRRHSWICIRSQYDFKTQAYT